MQRVYNKGRGVWADFRGTDHDCVATNEWKCHRQDHQRKWSIPWYHGVSAVPISVVEEVERSWEARTLRRVRAAVRILVLPE